MIWLDGQPCAPELARDGGFLFGASLFETIKLVDGRLRYRTDHLARLQRAADLLQWPLDRAVLDADLDRACATYPAGIYRLRLTLTRGDYLGLAPSGDACRRLLSLAPYTPPTDEERQHGVTAILAPNRRVNPLPHAPQLKSGNYLDCLTAAAAARQAGVREALFRSEDGRLLEGATSNVFLVRGTTLLTPPCDHEILDGVMRQRVLAAAPDVGWQVREEALTLADLASCDGACLTNALIGILPLSTVAERSIPAAWDWQPLQVAVDLLEA